MATPPRIALEIRDPRLRAALETLREQIDRAGGRVLAVGGCVRDAVLGVPAGEIDLEVYGLDAERLLRCLGRRFALDVVGRAFGIARLRGLPIDVSLPRRQSACGSGAPSLETGADPQLSPSEALRRRDFTLNAMGLDLSNGELIDPHGGLADLRARVLRHTGAGFGEDPLRVLRGMQLAARFELRAASGTLALCRSLSPQGLPRERVFGEWQKLVLLGRRPSRGLGFLRACGWLVHYPELAALVDCPQDPGWHPEGDVWTHTSRCMDAFARERVGEVREDLVVGLATLCHDFGKPATTRQEGDRITSRGHEAEGAALTRAFLERLTDEARLVDQVAPLVAEHLKPALLYAARAGDAAVRRLAVRARRIDWLVRVARADHRGRLDPNAAFAAGEWLLARARALEIQRAAPVPLVLGRHLISLGLEAGPRFGPILEACYQAQLDGEFDSEEAGIAFARRLLS